MPQPCDLYVCLDIAHSNPYVVVRATNADAEMVVGNEFSKHNNCAYAISACRDDVPLVESTFFTRLVKINK